ncbi:MAG: M56 family metallopeptidase, partial [Chthoniobacterales bacterium]
RIPVICLSPYALLWSREKLRVVFLHELAHWKRWDYGWQQIGKLVVALFWWNPLARMAAVRMSAEAEQAADDVVVLHETPAKVYAETLIEIASGISFANNPSAGISMIGYRSVEKRIRALLANNPWRGRIGRLAGFAILVAVLLTLGVSSVYVGFAAPVAAPAAKGQTVTKLTPEQRKLLERIFKNITERLTAMRFLHFKIDTLVKQENKADQLTKVDVWVDEWSGIHRSEIQRSPFNAVNNIDLNNGRHSYFFTPGANPEFLQGGKPEGVAYYLRIDETIDLAHLISVILQSSVLSRGEGEGVEISEVKWNGKKTVQLREKIPVNFTKEGKGIQQRTWRVDPASDDMLCFYERAFPTWNTYKPSQWTLQESGIADGNLYPKRYQYTQDQSQNWETSTEDNTVTFLEVLKKLPEGITALPKSETLMPGLKNEKRVDAEEASASATDLSSPEALALYDQVKAKYSSCSSFYCDGENKTTSTTLGGILPFKSETKFSIRFQRPALLRVDWVQPFPWPASLIAPANCSLYTEGGKYFTVTSFQRSPREMKSLNDAMGTAAGISAGASYMIPSLLLGAPGYFKDAACKILPDAKVGSRECSVLKLVIAKRGEDYTIYIDKTTSGILRIEDIKILNGKEREKMLAERKVANEKRKAESKSSLPEVPPVGYTINRNIEYTAVAFDQEMKPEDFIFKDKKE